MIGSGIAGLSCGWLLQQLAADLDEARRLSYRLGLACGLGEASRDSNRDIYPALYNQHIIDELAEAASDSKVLVSEALTADGDIANRCRLEGEGRFRVLAELTGPQVDLLERQRQLVLQELG